MAVPPPRRCCSSRPCPATPDWSTRSGWWAARRATDARRAPPPGLGPLWSSLLVNARPFVGGSRSRSGTVDEGCRRPTRGAILDEANAIEALVPYDVVRRSTHVQEAPPPAAPRRHREWPELLRGRGGPCGQPARHRRRTDEAG